MRSTQVYGLSPAATQLIEGEDLLVIEDGTRLFPDGSAEWFRREVHESSTKSCQDGDRVFHGMFDESYPLHRYELADGSVYVEDVQASPWSSGPCIFLALREGNSDGPWVSDSLWPQSEIEEA